MIKIKSIFIISLSVFTFFIIALGGIYYNDNMDNVLMGKAYDHLEAVAHLRADHIETFLTEESQRAVDFSSDWLIRDSLKRLSKGMNSSKITETLNNHLIINMMSTDKSIYHLMVLDSNGRVVGTTNPGNPHQSKFSNEIFLKGKVKPYTKEIFYDEKFRKNAIVFSAPIFNGEEFLGIIVVERTPTDLMNIVTKRTSLRGTEEIYVINDEGYLLTPSRFLRGQNKGILTQLINTDDARGCLKNIKEFDEVDPKNTKRYGNVLVSRDYRGEYVVGARWLMENRKWCVLAEMDEAEVLKGKIGFYKVSIFAGFAVIFAALIGFFIGTFLDKRYILRRKK